MAIAGFYYSFLLTAIVDTTPTTHDKATFESCVFTVAQNNRGDSLFWNPNTPRFLMPGGTITTHRLRKIVSVAY